MLFCFCVFPHVFLKILICSLLSRIVDYIFLYSPHFRGLLNSFLSVGVYDCKITHARRAKTLFTQITTHPSVIMMLKSSRYIEVEDLYIVDGKRLKYGNVDVEDEYIVELGCSEFCEETIPIYTEGCHPSLGASTILRRFVLKPCHILNWDVLFNTICISVFSEFVLVFVFAVL